jgi:hypothetical protein
LEEERGTGRGFFEMIFGRQHDCTGGVGWLVDAGVSGESIARLGRTVNMEKRPRYAAIARPAQTGLRIVRHEVRPGKESSPMEY